MTPSSTQEATLSEARPLGSGLPRLRWILLAILILGMVGTGTELFLLEHTEDWRQILPLVGLGLGIAVALGIVFRPRRGMVRILRALMVAFVASGILGIYFHFRGNIEFELEIFPSSGGLPLVWEALRGATPALAPGAMIQLGLLGLAYTYRHPLLRDDPPPRRSIEVEPVPGQADSPGEPENPS